MQKNNNMKKIILTIVMAVVAAGAFAQDYLPTIQEGTQAPEFTMADTLGVKHSLKDFRGKYVVIDFWASWCGDCRREMPEMIQLYNDFKDVTIEGKQIEWLGVSFDFDEGSWKRYLSTANCPWLQVCGMKKMKDSPVAKKYGISWIPSLVLVDDNGVVVAKAITAEALRKELVAKTKVMPLPQHSQTRGTDIMTTLINRHTDRQYEARPVNIQDKADILWSAVGINRENGNITSPTAMNRQEILVYVFDEDGVGLYDAKSNSLKIVAEGDHRKLVADRQDNFNDAPMFLVFVGDMDKFRMPGDHARGMVFADSGIAAENVNVFCAAVGIKTCIRATMNVKGIQSLLGLTENQIPMLNTAIGY